MKESIQFLLPIFIGFVITHVVADRVRHLRARRSPAASIAETRAARPRSWRGETGWVFVASRCSCAPIRWAAAPTPASRRCRTTSTRSPSRASRTGKWTMFYMALSLAFTAGGIILLYLLWDVRTCRRPDAERGRIRAHHRQLRLASRAWSTRRADRSCWCSKAACCSSPPTPASSAAPRCSPTWRPTRWVPHQFRHLSSRLVTQNGVLLMGVAALAVLVWSRRQRRAAGRAVQHQRVPDVLPVAVRPVHLLDQEPPRRAPLEAPAAAVGGRPIRDARHPAHARMSRNSAPAAG